MILRDELKADVQQLAGDIGERNLSRYPQLNAAADFIEKSFRACWSATAPRQLRRSRPSLSQYRSGNPREHRRKSCSSARITILFLVRPARTITAPAWPALLALARRFAGKETHQTLRFVAFVNEEPPYFQTSEMGSFVYAGRCKARGDRIVAMISLETIGYFSDAPRSQTYPVAALGAFYPKVGNFIGIVGNVPLALAR